MVVLEMALASLSLVFPGWLIWRAFSTSRQLEQRLAQGDATLLNDERFSIDRVTLGPPGTQLIEDVEFIPVQQIPTIVPQVVSVPPLGLNTLEMNSMDEHVEIERRFLVDARGDKPWMNAATSQIEQYYTVGELLSIEDGVLSTKGKPWPPSRKPRKAIWPPPHHGPPACAAEMKPTS